MKFEKGPGWDWVITYEGEEGIQIMSVFGQTTIESAILEARRSFDEDDMPAILEAKRV